MGYITVSQTNLNSMKFLCILLIAAPAFCLPSPSNRQTDIGMMDPAEATLMCTAGTEVGAKLEQAFSNCMSPPAGRKSLMRDGCPSFSDIMDWVESKYSDDACILSEIGWMNNDYSFNEETIMADIGSLDATVAAPITEDAMAECAAEKIEEMTSDASECLSAYSEEEMQQLSQVGTQIAHYECFLELFEEGCTDYLTGATGSGMENENGK